MIHNRWQKLAWLTAVLLTVNLYLVPVSASSPRATDVMGLIALLAAIYLLANGRLPRKASVVAGVTLLTPLLWTFFGFLNGDTATAVQAARWLLALPVALLLVPLAGRDDLQTPFAWGLVVGGLVGTLVIILQARGFEGYLKMVGLSSSGAAFHHWVSQSLRLPGLHGHHNASSAVISLLVPAGMYLYLKGRCGLPVLLGMIGALLISLHLTSTRGPLLVAVVTLAYSAAVARRFARSLLIGLAVLLIITPLVMVYGPPGGWARWKNTEALVSNANERIDSNLGSLKLSVEHPLGLGVTATRTELADKTAFRATHNAFLQAVLVFGIPLGLLVTFSVAGLALKGLGGTDHPLFFPALIAFHLAGLFMFEEHLNNPTFIVLTVWIILVMWGRPEQADPGETSSLSS